MELFIGWGDPFGLQLGSNGIVHGLGVQLGSS